MTRNTKSIFKFLLFTALISALLLVAASAANVVYLKDGGAGDGSSPENAVNTLTKAHNALDLTRDDATIVVCGPYTQSVNWLYSGGEFAGTVTFTSVYDGVDYRESANAVYNIGAVRFLCLGNNRFENLSFNCTGANCVIVGQHYGVTLGEGVSVSGDKLAGTAIANSFAIIGGYQDGTSLAVADSSADTNVTVLSGDKLYIVPFSRGVEGAVYTGTANITVGGTAKVGVLHGSAATPDGVTLGDVKITLEGSAYVDKFYGCTNNVTVNSYTFNWNGGTIGAFNWVCPATADKTLTVTGKKTFNIGGNVDYKSIMNHFDVVNGAPVVFVMDGGKGDGSTAAQAASTLAAAFKKLDLTKPCTVVICGSFTQSADYSYGKAFSGSVTFTSVYNGVDYRESAGANWQFKNVRFACFGETAFENLSFVSLGGSYLVAAQHNPVTVGDGVTVAIGEGVSEDALTGATMAKSFVIMGGYEKGFGAPTAVNANPINITVNSGSFIYVLAFSHDVTGIYRGVANITLGGTADVGVVHCSCAYPTGIAVGDVRITVKDEAILRRLYGATQTCTINSVEVNWLSGRIHTANWTAGTSATLTVKNPTVLRVSDEVAINSSYYSKISTYFDAVVNAAGVDTDIACANPTANETAALSERAGANSFAAVNLSGSDKAQITLGIPVPDVTEGIVYRMNGDFLVPVDTDALGNGRLIFDLEGDATYVCSATELVKYGDLNRDGNINVVDTLLLIKALLGDSGMDKAAADVDMSESLSLVDALRHLKSIVETEEEEPQDLSNYNVLPVERYLDKTKLGFLSQLVGFLSGYEFATGADGNPIIAMADSYFEMCNGPYADYKSINPRTDKLLYNEESGLWETYNDDDFSIDILNQHILRDSYEKYGTFNSKTIGDDWVYYNVYDMGGGNRDIGCYSLFKRFGYLSVFAGNTEMENNFTVNGEPYIGNETLGMNAAGMPNVAVDLAHKFGSATSERDPLDWLRMFAAMYSMAYFESDIPTLIRTSQAATLPKGSWPDYIVDKCFELYAKYPTDWRKAVKEADTVFRSTDYDHSSYMGCTSINCSFIILGLLYGDGDYYNTCKIISLAGHGGDSTTPTALGIVGVICGWTSLDSTSKSIINEKVWQDGNGVIVNLPVDPTTSYGTWMYMAANADERFNLKDLIYMYQSNFENILYENGGFKQDGNYYIPKQTITPLTTVYAEHFETNGVSDYTATGGKVTLADLPFMGSKALQVNAASSGKSEAYTTVSGLTVGKTYKLTAFVRTTEGVTAHMFARKSGATDYAYVTAHDPGSYIRRYTVGEGQNDVRSYVRRDLIFTATAASMQIGLALPAGTPTGGNASFDALELTVFDENTVCDVTVSGNKNKNGAYNGLIRFDIDGGSETEVWLKVTYSCDAANTVKVPAHINHALQSKVPLVPTNGGKVTIFFPVLVNKEKENLVTLYVGQTDVEIFEAELIQPDKAF